MREAVRPDYFRTAVLVFGVLVLINTFFDWSFPAWFCIFGPPDGLLTPRIDQWVITPLAVTAFLLQFPSYMIVYNVEPLSSLHPPATVVVASLLSLAIYLPPVLWLKWRRMQRRAVRQ